jgi:RNA-directed DNA polymerase
MSLATPIAIRTLQRKLYCKAKAEPAFRFYLLYDKIYRDDILRHAYALAHENAGAPGVDGVTFAVIEAAGVEAWLAGLRVELVAKTYRPDPVRRVSIPKADGEGERMLGIPTIRDRVVQTAAKLVLEPIFEADFEDNAYGYRPARGAFDAVKDVHRHICRGYTNVVDADLSRYFDSIPHDDLKVPIEERVRDGKRRMRGGKRNRHGTPQGGVVSPMLANIYMNRFLKHWRLTGRGEAFRAHVVAYADDFVILSRGHAAEALAWTQAVMTKLGLTLNEAKTSVKNAQTERFDFLGYSFGLHHYGKTGQRYLGASPSKKSVGRIKAKVSELLVPRNTGAWPEVRDRLNLLLQGWSAYFGYGTQTQACQAINHHVYDRVRNFLRRRHQMHGRGTRKFGAAAVFGTLGVLQLRRVPAAPPP